MAQGSCSPQNQAIAAFGSRHAEHIGARFKTVETGVVVPGNEAEYGSQIFLKQTYALNGVPPIGSLCVAVYNTRGPAIDLINTDNIVHHEVDLALLLRSAEGDEATDALDIAKNRDIKSETAKRLALIFEAIVPKPWQYNGQPLYLKTGLRSPSFLPL